MKPIKPKWNVYCKMFGINRYIGNVYCDTENRALQIARKKFETITKLPLSVVKAYR